MENQAPCSSKEKHFLTHTKMTMENIRSKFESLLSEESSDEESTVNNANGDEPETTIENIENPGSSKSHTILSDDKDEIILSMVWYSNRLGAAYYNVATSELYAMDDVDDDVTFNVTKSLYRQVQPNHVVTTAGAFESFLDVVKRLILMETLQEGEGSTSSFYRKADVILKIMPKKDYNFENCYHRVRCLRLENEPKDASNAERVTFLNGLLNFKSQAMIYALGLLLSYVDKHWNTIALDPSGRPSFISLNNVTLQDLVMVDEETYKSLNIAETRSHPSFFKFGNTATKIQGTSLFTFLNRCQSRPGAQFLWKTIRQPTRNIQELNDRLDVIQFFLDPQNYSVVEHLTSCLKHISRLTRTILNRYSRPNAKAADWGRLHKTVSYVICIADICGNYRSKTKLFEKLVNSITNEMHYIKYFIEYIVDFEASRQENTFVVKMNVDPLLDELNHMKSKLPGLLTEMGKKDMENHLKFFATGCKMIYLPHVGFLSAVTKWINTPPQETDLPGFEFKLTINGIRYYKSPGARELDESVGDVSMKITKRQSQIMLRLVRYINKHAKPILDAVQLCAELDTLLSFYIIARDYNYTRPKIVDSQIIAVKQGRHPLLELLGTCVPNDIYSGYGRSLVKILTGPHASGKSVYLKQVALIVFMAHIGSYVPAESATIGVVARILIQMHSLESIALDSSGFLQDLRQINAILQVSTPNALIIIDEFGKGTSEISGLSLLAAVLTNFVEKQNSCPHIFAATHIHRVVGLIQGTELIETQTFDYVTNKEQDLVFLYRLIPGNAKRSYAHVALKIAGLDEKLVKRSLQVFEQIKKGELPTRLPEAQRQDTAKHVIERVARPNTQVNLEELKLWIRQTMPPYIKK